MQEFLLVPYSIFFGVFTFEFKIQSLSFPVNAAKKKSEFNQLLIDDFSKSTTFCSEWYSIASKTFLLARRATLALTSNTIHELLARSIILLLTHEFGTVVDMVHTMKRNFGAVSTATFLSTRNGVLQEQQIHADDIKAYPTIAEKTSKNQVIL